VENNIARGNPSINGQYCGGQFVPFQAFAAEHTRDMQATAFASGGAFVQSDMAGVIPILLNRSVCLRLGATVASGLKGNLILPRQESAVTVEAKSEIAAAVASNPTVGGLSMLPHRLSVNLVASKQLLIQGGEAGEAFLRAMIFDAIGQKLDQLTLLGQGAADEPLGIVNTPGIGSVVFNGQATWSKLMAFEDALGAMNADGDSLGWAVSSNTRTRWKQIPRTTNGTNFLWDQIAVTEAMVAGFRALATNNLSAGHTSILGNWPFCIIGIWGNGFDLVVDQYSLAKDAEVIFSCHLWVDTALAHPQAFCVSADAANQ
jgi:HK97 family phage major capsid protein